MREHCRLPVFFRFTEISSKDPALIRFTEISSKDPELIRFSDSDKNCSSIVKTVGYFCWPVRAQRGLNLVPQSCSSYLDYILVVVAVSLSCFIYNWLIRKFNMGYMSISHRFLSFCSGQWRRGARWLFYARSTFFSPSAAVPPSSLIIPHWLTILSIILLYS